MKTKWIAGVAAICLVSAAAASAMTVLMMTRGLPGFSLPLQETTETTTFQPVSPTPSPAPTRVPTPSPSPRPTITPIPTIAPEPAEPSPSVVEGLIILQTQILIEEIYQRVAPSVVRIEIEVAEIGSSQFRTNLGSGLILRETGEIATNASILSIALDKKGNLLSNALIRVMVKGVEKPFEATLVGRDIMSGLAVIRINPADTVLTPGQFADSSEIRIGQIVLAVGYPEILYEAGGLSNGLITGLNRTVLHEDGLPVQMIQTNAPISLSSSGGPLLNLNGEVIGLTNCAVFRDTLDSFSYVLPSAAVQAVSTELIVNGQMAGRSWLGITVLSEAGFLELQRLYGLPDGLYVSSVINDSPAYTADLRRNDIITAINGVSVGTSMDISRFLQINPPGTMVDIRVFRRSDGRFYNLKTYLQEKNG